MAPRTDEMTRNTDEFGKERRPRQPGDYGPRGERGESGALPSRSGAPWAAGHAGASEVRSRFVTRYDLKTGKAEAAFGSTILKEIREAGRAPATGF